MGRSLEQCLRAMRGFRGATGANVATTFALATIPIIGLVGSAVDYSRANATRAAMQSALDATALMLSKNAAGMSSSQITSSASAYFNALFTRPEAKSIQISAVYSTTGGSQVVLSSTAKIDTNFMALMGYDSLDIKATSTAKWGMSRLRVALALDNTGSMQQSGKMPALKTAAKKLLKQLQAAATQSDDVYVSIVPFAKDVNVGSSYYNSTWVDFNDHGSWSGWKSNNGSCNKTDSRGRTIRNASDCDDARGRWTASTPSASNWGGCVADRDQDYDVDATTPDTTKRATLYPAEDYSDCPVAMMPLSNDWTALKNKIDAMQPAGMTNITIGLAWGWQTLTDNAPFQAPAKSPNYQYQDVIILLTDGENTQNRFGSRQSDVDARTKKACANAKAAKITIYTILVMQGTQSLLQNCASDSSKYFYLTSADQLIAAFDSIGTSLSNLRIAN